MTRTSTSEVDLGLRFDNSFLRDLPKDPIDLPGARQVLGAGYSLVLPTPTASPELRGWSAELASRLGIPPGAQKQELAAAFSGNRLIVEGEYYASCYGGHQFGNWAGQLGDGRAISLGEVIGAEGGRWELQLKGAGPTPYSRTADGRAVLRSSVREFLCSEAMYHLGVPTTRALSLALTGDKVLRDRFYDGRAGLESGAVVCRVAPSFLRFGNFQIFAQRGDLKTLRALYQHTLRRHFPQLVELPESEGAVKLLEEVCKSTAAMIVHWMRVGFVHGVMNTDNMSVLGLTIDYGPYGWMNDYNPGWTPNTTDAQGRRYRFGHQSQIAFWNLVKFAEALLPLVQNKEALQGALDVYVREFSIAERTMMLNKLGLSTSTEPTEKQEQLISSLLSLLAEHETDFTLFFRLLADTRLVNQAAQIGFDDGPVTPQFAAALLGPLGASFYEGPGQGEAQRAPLAAWVFRYLSLARDLGVSDAARAEKMHRTNPKFVLRNYLVQEAIEAAEAGDWCLFEALYQRLERPYEDAANDARWCGLRPEWARDRPGCSQLSCSS